MHFHIAVMISYLMPPFSLSRSVFRFAELGSGDSVTLIFPACYFVLARCTLSLMLLLWARSVSRIEASARLRRNCESRNGLSWLLQSHRVAVRTTGPSTIIVA